MQSTLYSPNTVVSFAATPSRAASSLTPLLLMPDITALFLVLLSYSPSTANNLALSPMFISAIGHYIKHLDPAIRRCGMLVAEEVATLAGKKLEFGDWEGRDAERIWARSLRLLIRERDIDAKDIEPSAEEQLGARKQDESSPVEANPASPAASRHTIRVENAAEPDSDDDSLQGYASEENSDRAPSPTRSELEEIENDPTLNVGVKKIPKPVYLAQLGELVRSTNVGLKSAENNEPDKIEMALGCGEELIRRKRNFGMELGRCHIHLQDETQLKSCATEENAVNLVYVFVGLQDSYELDDFSTKRQGIVTALVACCPRKSAPCVRDSVPATGETESHPQLYYRGVFQEPVLHRPEIRYADSSRTGGKRVGVFAGPAAKRYATSHIFPLEKTSASNASEANG